MFAACSATHTGCRALIGKFNASADIAFPPFFMTRDMFLGNIYISRRLNVKSLKLLTRSATIRTFQRRNGTVINMTAILTFPSCKCIHTF